MSEDFFWVRCDAWNDPRLGELKPADALYFFRLLDIKNKGLTDLDNRLVADEWQVSSRKVTGIKQRLLKAGLVDEHWQLVDVNWFRTKEQGG